MAWGWWLYIAAIAFAPTMLILGWKWIKAAIHIRRTHLLRGHREWEPTTADQLSPEMIEFVRHAVEGFRGIGFEVAHNARQREGVTGVLDAHRLLLVNRTTNDTALAPLVRTKTTRSLVLVITSTFADQSRIVTSSRQQIGFLPKDPRADSANFPQVTEPPLLWAAHLKRLERAGRGRERRIAPARGEEEPYLRGVEERERQRMVACGYHYRVPSGDYRLTWKGAVLATCKLMEPVKGWRTRRARRKSDRLWRELEMKLANRLNTIDPAGSAGPTEQSPVGQPNSARSAHLPYDAVLRAGEIRQSSEADGLTVRVGLPGVGQVLASRWVVAGLACIRAVWAWLYSAAVVDLAEIVHRFRAGVRVSLAGDHAFSLLLDVVADLGSLDFVAGAVAGARDGRPGGERSRHPFCKCDRTAALGLYSSTELPLVQDCNRWRRSTASNVPARPAVK